MTNVAANSVDRVLIPLGHHLLVMTRQAFEAALAEGDTLRPYPAEAATRVQGRALLDADATALRLSVDRSWLLRGARERRLPFYRLGKYVRFDPEEIIAYCAKQGQISHE